VMHVRHKPARTSGGEDFRRHTFMPTPPRRRIRINPNH
jgi:hypothetical protein